MRKRGVQLFQLIVVLVCITYAFWDLDVDLFLKIISGYNLVAFFVAVLLLFSGFFALAGRLSSLSNGEIKISHSVIGTIIGQGSNNVLPAKLGEVVKAYYLSRKSSRTIPWFFGLVFWERFFDLNILLVCGLFILFTMNPAFPISFFLVLVLSLWLTLYVFFKWKNKVVKFVKLLPFEKLKNFIVELLEHLTKGLEGKMIVKASIWTILIWLQYVAQVAVILLWGAELNLSFAAILVIFVVSGIGLNLAASPGGVGVYEAAIVASASWYGIGREEALAAAVVLHVIQYVPTTILGIYFMYRSNITYSEMKSRVRESK